MRRPERTVTARRAPPRLPLRRHLPPGHDVQGPQPRHRLVFGDRPRMADLEIGLRGLAPPRQFHRGRNAADPAVAAQRRGSLGRRASVKRALLIAAISVWSVLGPAAAGATDNAIVGYWYGRGYQPTLGRDNEFIDHHAPDGKFEVHFRAYEGCKVVEDQSEAGTWAMLDADTVRVTTTSVD